MHPIIFQSEFFNLTTLTLFTTIAILAGTITIIKLSAFNSLKIQFLSEKFLMIIISAILGGRLFGLIINYKFYLTEISNKGFLQVFKIWDDGFSAIAAILSGLLYLYFACKKEEQDFFKWLDVIIPSILIALVFVHLGDFFNGSNYGKPTSLPWGVNFENPIIKYTVPIHPTQMYAFVYSTAILTAAYFLSKHPLISSAKPGFLSLLIISAYSFFRFIEDFVRGDDTILIFGIRLTQIISFIIFAASAYFIIKKIKTFQKINSTN